MVELVPSELYGPRVVSPGRETDTAEAKALEGPLCSGDVVTATMGAKRENKTEGHLPWPLLPPTSVTELLATDKMQELCDLE